MAAAGGSSAQTDAVIVRGAPELEACVARDAPSAELDSSVATCVRRLRGAGYLELSVDDVVRSGDTLLVVAHQGPRYDLGRLVARVDTSREYGLMSGEGLGEPADLPGLGAAVEGYLDEREREGRPFARVRFDSLRIAGDERLDLRASAWSGPRITYDGVRFAGLEAGEEPVGRTYLERTLRVEPGRVFRVVDLERIERRLRGVRFLAAATPPRVVFESGRAVVALDVRPRQTSRFDFLLGFLPNSAANDGQLLLTGDVTLELENALRRGERLYFSFERLQPEVTELESEAAYPYLLDSPFGARGRFGLYRQADEWLRLEYEAGGSYAFGGGDAYELYYEGGQAQVLGFDTAATAATQRLPEVLDAVRNGFGMRLRLDRRDDVFDTREGWRLSAEASAARREVSVPESIRALGDALAARADTAAATTGQYRFGLDAGAFVPTGRRTTLALLVRGAAIAGADVPLRNELYRIGGNRLLRGFDEQTVQAGAYLVTTAEYRLLVGGGSYLFAFADQGLVRDPYRDGDRTDEPTGFGAGLRLATRAGALSLSYAYGRRGGAPVEWERAKVHVGFESRF